MAASRGLPKVQQHGLEVISLAAHNQLQVRLYSAAALGECEDGLLVPTLRAVDPEAVKADQQDASGPHDVKGPSVRGLRVADAASRVRVDIHALRVALLVQQL